MSGGCSKLILAEDKHSAHLHSGAEDQHILDGLDEDSRPRPHQAHGADGLLLPAVLQWYIIPG